MHSICIKIDGLLILMKSILLDARYLERKIKRLLEKLPFNIKN